MYFTNLLWSTVKDSFEAHGDTLSKGVKIVVTVLEITARFTFWSTSTSMVTGSGDPGLDLAVLKEINRIKTKPLIKLFSKGYQTLHIR